MTKLETEESLESLYTAKEMARLLKVSQPTLDSWRKQGVIPCIWRGYIVRYERSKVLAALRKFQRKGGSQ